MVARPARPRQRCCSGEAGQLRCSSAKSTRDFISASPCCRKNLPILEELGVLDEIHRIGVFKPGADFTSPGHADDIKTYAFDRALGDSPPHAYQIRRSEFDKVLFDNCCECRR